MPTSSECPPGRLGCVATFAPSGVAAGNCGGFTFHNGLHTHTISELNLQCPPSTQVLSKLQNDFAQVQCIVVDEFSMTSLVLLAYLDKVTKCMRPSRALVPFAGIPVIITGDTFQLPVVNGKGILSNPNTIGDRIQGTFSHSTNGVFCLKLSHSVRQGSDEHSRKYYSE